MVTRARAKRARPNPARASRKLFPFHRRELNFLARFGLSFILLFLSIHALPLGGLISTIASVETNALKALGIPASQEGPFIHTPQALFEIVVDCSGLVMASLFASLVLSTNVHAPLRALLLGVPFLLAFNLFRLLLTLIAGGAYGQVALDAVHFTLWIVDTLVVLFLWTLVVDPRNPLR